jgi:hypothetical protein
VDVFKDILTRWMALCDVSSVAVEHDCFLLLLSYLAACHKLLAPGVASGATNIPPASPHAPVMVNSALLKTRSGSADIAGVVRYSSARRARSFQRGSVRVAS